MTVLLSTITRFHKNEKKKIIPNKINRKKLNKHRFKIRDQDFIIAKR